MTPKAVNLYTLQVVLRELGPPWGLEGKEEWLSHCILVNLARSWGVASCLVTGHWADNKGALLWFFKNDQPCTPPKRHSFKSCRAWRVARMREVHFWILRVGFAILGCFFADHHMSMNIYSQCTGTILYGLRGLFKTMFSLHFSKDDVRTISKLQAKRAARNSQMQTGGACGMLNNYTLAWSRRLMPSQLYSPNQKEINN